MLGAASAVASCDAGKRHTQQTLGPAVLIVGLNVGEGRPMPADGAIQIAFDRYLLPSTVNRQSLAVIDGANKPLPPELAPIVLYDPIARTVTLAPPQQPWLTEGQPYKVVLGVPEGDADTGGLRAIDRATLFPNQPREFAFFVGPKVNVPIEPAVTFCHDVLPIFTAKCSWPTCHGGNGDRALASLLLDTSAGVGATALNRVAQGSNRGPHAGQVTTSERLFGVDMPLIDPGSPGTSWLLYKVELPPTPAAKTVTPHYACQNGLLDPDAKAFVPLAPNAQRAADEIERAILSDYILGREMPFPVANPSSYEDVPLTFQERETVRLWIQSMRKGEGVPECGGCALVPEPDAGASEAGTDAADAGDAADQ